MVLISQHEDPDEAYNSFIEEYSGIYIACFPLKVLKGKQVSKLFSPWLSPGLLKSVSIGNHMRPSTIKD